MGQPTTQAAIAAGLASLGVQPGDVLVVHSSLSSFGHVEGGADAVVSALVQSVSPGGSVFVPTFTYGRAPFDPATTPSFDGAISESLRRRPDALRSLHPTHAWAAIGPDARGVLAGHEHARPFGEGSPMWKLWKRGDARAKVLLIGVDHRANSMIHVAEESLALPYLDRTREAAVVRAGGSVEQVTVRRGPCSRGFNKLDTPLRAAGCVAETMVGRARLLLAPAADVVSVAANVLRADSTALLCDAGTCERCDESRRMLRE